MTSLTNDAPRWVGPWNVRAVRWSWSGHAYSGAVIAAVKEERVKALVYIAALAPDKGETVANVFYRDKPSGSAQVSSRFAWLYMDAGRWVSPGGCP